MLQWPACYLSFFPIVWWRQRIAYRLRRVRRGICNSLHSNLEMRKSSEQQDWYVPPVVGHKFEYFK